MQLKYFNLILLLFISLLKFGNGNSNSEEHISLSSQIDTKYIDELLLESMESFISDVEHSEKLARQALDFSYDLNYNYGIAHSSYLIAKVMSDSEFHISESYLLTASEFAKKITDSVLIAKIHIEKGNINWYARNFTDALINYQTAEILINRIKNDSLLAEVYNCMGIYYASQNIDSIATEKYLKSIELNKKLKHKYPLAKNYINIANFYLELNFIEEAKQYLEKSLEISIRNSFSRLTPVIYINLGKLYLLSNDYENAINNSRTSLKLIHPDNYNYIAFAYKIISDSYERQSLMDSAYFNLEKYSYYSDKLSEKQLMVRLSEREKEFDFQQKLKENQITKLKERQRNFLIFLFLFILIIVLLILFLFQRYSLIKKQKMNELIKLENFKLEENINVKNRQLTFDKLKIKSKNALINKTLNALQKKDAESEVTSSKSIEAKIISELKIHQRYNSWSAFEKDFTETYPDFRKNMLLAYPTLTQYEIRLCSFLKMSMTSKEISEILKITADSVVKSRTRLRKKLNLTGAKESIYSVLEKF